MIFTPTLNPHLKDIKSISPSFKHTIFISGNDDVYGCGDNSKGVLGIEDKNEFKIKGRFTILTKLNWNLNNEKIKKVKCGWNNTYVLTEDGEVFSVGVGKFGQLGYLNDDTSVPAMSNTFKKIKFAENISDIYIGSDFSFAYSDRLNGLFSWGWNEHYNLGHNSKENIYEPKMIKDEIILNIDLDKDWKVNIKY